MAPLSADRTGFVGASTPSLTTRTRLPTSSRTPLPTAATAAAQAVAARLPTSSAPNLATQLIPQRIENPFSARPSAGASSGTSIVLFRSDLRLDDHPALKEALEQSSSIVPLFCFDPRHFGRTEHGFDKTGRYRARFLLESVANLRENLRKLGADLVIRHGRPEDVVPELASSVGAKRVWLHREVTYEEQEVEAALKKKVMERGIEMRTLWANTLYDREDLPFTLKEMPDVYSDFREAVEMRGKIRKPLPAPEELQPLPVHIEVGEIPTLRDLAISEEGVAPVRHSHGVCAVKGGEDEAMTRVRSYVRDARAAGNDMGGSQVVTAHLGADFSCRISPWLALGCVSPRRIFHNLMEGAASPMALHKSSTYLELVWRDFFRCITAKYSERRADVAGRPSVRSSKAMAVGV